MVKNTQEDDYMVDTVSVPDRTWRYETAVMKDDINDGYWVIVDSADTKEEALEKHEKWVLKIREGVDELFDICLRETYKRDKG